MEAASSSSGNSIGGRLQSVRGIALDAQPLPNVGEVEETVVAAAHGRRSAEVAVGFDMLAVAESWVVCTPYECDQIAFVILSGAKDLLPGYQISGLRHQKGPLIPDT